MQALSIHVSDGDGCLHLTIATQFRPLLPPFFCSQILFLSMLSVGGVWMSSNRIEANLFLMDHGSLAFSTCSGDADADIAIAGLDHGLSRIWIRGFRKHS